VGPVDLRHGSIQDVENRKFLVEEVTASFVNNFDGQFGHRSTDRNNQKWCLDDIIVGLFAQMKAGARMAVLDKLPMGCSSRSVANKYRKQRKLPESDDASFYEMEESVLGKSCSAVSWSSGGGNDRPLKVYTYTRTDQSTGRSVFLCNNTDCVHGRSSQPVEATRMVGEGWVVMNNCECRVADPSLRGEPT
jgi:hypothetical protein